MDHGSFDRRAAEAAKLKMASRAGVRIIADN
jgi:hypothetical protein